MRPSPEAAELERIRAAYRRRDAERVARPVDPAYARYRAQLDRALRAALERGDSAALRGGSVLDVGCGAGELLRRLAELGAGEACGIDLVPARIADGRRRHPSLDLHSGTATALPFADGVFDLVAQFTCLSSVRDPGVRTQIAAEMWRVARPGGLVLSFDMTPSLARRAAEGVRRRRHPGATPVYPVSRGELGRWFPGEVVAALGVTATTGLGRLGRLRATGAAAARAPLHTHLMLAVRRGGDRAA